jgi:transposase
MVCEVSIMDSKDGRKGKRPRRQFTDEFRAGAVRLVLEEGRAIAEVARDLDLHRNSLRLWVKQARVDRGQGPTGALTSSEKEELQQLRRENRRLKMERDILKKAAAFFAKENT